MKILIIILLLTLSACSDTNYKCSNKQLELVNKQVNICAKGNSSYNRKTCFNEARRAICTKIE